MQASLERKIFGDAQLELLVGRLLGQQLGHVIAQLVTRRHVALAQGGFDLARRHVQRQRQVREQWLGVVGRADAAAGGRAPGVGEVVGAAGGQEVVLRLAVLAGSKLYRPIDGELAYRNEHAHTLQLWLNLPRADKLCTPWYRDIQSADIPELTTPEGVLVRVIAQGGDGGKGHGGHGGGHDRGGRRRTGNANIGDSKWLARWSHESTWERLLGLTDHVSCDDAERIRLTIGQTSDDAAQCAGRRATEAWLKDTLDVDDNVVSIDREAATVSSGPRHRDLLIAIDANHVGRS